MDSDDSSAPIIRPKTTSLCQTTATILVWYALSNLIILTTKWLFNNHFDYPLTVTFFSNFVSSLWAAGLSRHPKLRAPFPSKHQFRSYILPIGFLQALEIGCSNLALNILTVSFGTILKGSAPIFTFGWGLVFGLEGFSLPTVGCLVTIAVGIALASLGEGQEFQLVGFSLQLFATAMGGMRWAMTHKLLQQDTTTTEHTQDTTTENTVLRRENDDFDDQPPIHQTMSPLTTSLYTQPVTALCVLPVALGLELSSIWNMFSKSTDDNNNNSDNHSNNIEAIIILSTMTGIATLVFFLLMSEYWLVKMTSSLSMSVAATFKELLTIGGGVLFFADKIYLLNVIGFCTCQFGIFFYVFLRYERPVTDSSYMTAPMENAPPIVDEFPTYTDDIKSTNDQDRDNDYIEYPRQIT